MPVVVAAIFAVGLVLLLRAGARGRAQRQEQAATVRFVVDASGVERDLADGREERIAWSEVRAVDVVCLPKGPWAERVRIVLHGDEQRGAIVPLDVAESGGLLGHLGTLPGFDHRALVEALAAPQVGATEVWARATRT